MRRNTLDSNRWLRRKKFLRRVVFVFLFSCFLAVCLAVGAFFVEILKIENINVQGAVILSADEIRDKAEEIIAGKILGIIPQNRFFSFPEEKIKIELLKHFGRLSEIEIEKDFPAGILIKAQERKPAALHCSPTCFFIDKTGFAFEKAPVFSSGVYLKIFSDSDLTEDQLNKLLAFKNKIEVFFEVKEIRLKENRVCEFYLSNNWFLILDSGDNWDLVYNNFRTFLRETLEDDFNRDIEYIDLRFGNKIYYK